MVACFFYLELCRDSSSNCPKNWLNSQKLVAKIASNIRCVSHLSPYFYLRR